MIKQHGINPVPSKLEANKIATWKKCRRYFTDISHHKKKNIDQFESNLILLESLLHGLLVPPKTFENMQALLRIIERGQGDGNSNISAEVSVEDARQELLEKLNRIASINKAKTSTIS